MTHTFAGTGLLLWGRGYDIACWDVWLAPTLSQSCPTVLYTCLPCLLTQQVLIFKSSSDIQPSYPLRLQSTLPNDLQVTIWDSWGVVFKRYGGMDRPWLRRLGFGLRFEWESHLQTVPCLKLPISLLLLIDYIQWREPCWESWTPPSLWHGHYTRWTTVEMISPKEDIPTERLTWFCPARAVETQ